MPAFESEFEAIDREYAASVQALPRARFRDPALSQKHSG
jgi:hypothetical protein